MKGRESVSIDHQLKREVIRKGLQEVYDNKISRYKENKATNNIPLYVSTQVINFIELLLASKISNDSISPIEDELK